MGEEQKQSASLAHGLTDGWKFDSDTEGWRVESPSGDSCYLFNADSEHGQASGPAIREVFRQLVGDLHFHRHEELASSPQPAQNAAVLRDLAQALAWQCFGECRGYSERLLSPIDALAAARDVLGIPAAQAAPQAAESVLREASLWLHATYDRPPQTPDCAAMLARVDAALAGQSALQAGEAQAWRARFPQYEFRPQDDCVALKLERPAGEDARPVAWISTVMCVGPDYGKERYGKLPIQSLQPGYYKHTPLYATPQPAAQAAPAVPESERCKELTDAEIERGWHATFSTSNPYCPCNLKSFTKAVRWAVAALTIQGASHD
ncbi:MULTISPECIES: hypothetical protein [Cupriavidus]